MTTITIDLDVLQALIAFVENVNDVIDNAREAIRLADVAIDLQTNDDCE